MTQTEATVLRGRLKRASPRPWKLWGGELRYSDDPDNSDVEKTKRVASFASQQNSSGRGSHVTNAYLTAETINALPTLLDDQEKAMELLREVLERDTWHASTCACVVCEDSRALIKKYFVKEG